MPKRTDINTILLIGSGPIIIGQACEFDYSGTQAAKTLKKLGYKVVLINSNPATIMTDPEFADRTYIEPITADIIEDIIKKEKIDAILPTMGGQTALNVAMEMYEAGRLKGVKFLGANPAAIKKGEDRQAFKEAMVKIGMDLPKSMYAYNLDEAMRATTDIGFPLIIRASYTLAGGGSGVAYNVDEFRELAQRGLDASPISEILIEESLLGWKEFEMEVIRDCKDNCIIVCSIENLDPMGVHTGDSITIAPALTLTDKEYQRMRDASFKILREIGVDTGGSNVQFAINPENGRMTVIEMNPRVSRSSALASKATGYPIAKVATLLAVGFTLDEITNDITGTPASFEPSIDYIVAKIPRFTFEKFPQSDSTLTTAMKSIGEVMAIGVNFSSAIQKALCSLETGLSGLESISSDVEFIKNEVRRPNEARLLFVADAFRVGLSLEEIYQLCKIDRWFLNEIRILVECERGISAAVLNDERAMFALKNKGFSDKFIAKQITKNDGVVVSENEVFLARQRLGVCHVYNEVDTCAAEFETRTSYLYSSVASGESPLESPIPDQSPKVLILGGGPNRIGQGIEFDYCCVHASFALADMGVKSIMYNCNPETVSTDYDTSDALYFEPITLEFVRSVIEKEKPDGVIVHFGGQTPLKLAKHLRALNANIIGTSAKTIDIAEDREKFAKFVEQNALNQPKNGIATTKEEAHGIAATLGYPVLVRPSYVLGGRAMRIIHSDEELRAYMDEAVRVSEDSPVLVDKFLENAIELDIDAISDGESVYIGGMMQHIEEAGIHSGDSASSLPTISIPDSLVAEMERLTAKIALNLGVVGLVNIQFAIYQNSVYLIEVNPRASRTVPFVSKATGMPLAKIATRVMWKHALRTAVDSSSLRGAVGDEAISNDGILDEALRFYDKFKVVETHKIDDYTIYKPKKLKHVAVKESVFPFNKLLGADVILGPEMKSTGEVMGISHSFGLSFAKAQMAAKNFLPSSGAVFLSLSDADKKKGVEIAKKFVAAKFSILATEGTHNALKDAGVESKMVLKISQGRPNIADALANNEVALAINTSDARSNKEDARLIRQQIVRLGVPYFTTLTEATASLEAIRESLFVSDSGHASNPASTATALQDFLK